MERRGLMLIDGHCCVKMWEQKESVIEKGRFGRDNNHNKKKKIVRKLFETS
jgi:hypothetical protein